MPRPLALSTLNMSARLERVGARQQASAGADMLDSVFIEDIAIVFDAIAVITRDRELSRAFGN